MHVHAVSILRLFFFFFYNTGRIAATYAGISTRQNMYLHCTIKFITWILKKKNAFSLQWCSNPSNANVKSWSYFTLVCSDVNFTSSLVHLAMKSKQVEMGGRRKREKELAYVIGRLEWTRQVHPIHPPGSLSPLQSASVSSLMMGREGVWKMNNRYEEIRGKHQESRPLMEFFPPPNRLLHTEEVNSNHGDMNPGVSQDVRSQHNFPTRAFRSKVSSKVDAG